MNLQRAVFFGVWRCAPLLILRIARLRDPRPCCGQLSSLFQKTTIAATFVEPTHVSISNQHMSDVVSVCISDGESSADVRAANLHP